MDYSYKKLNLDFKINNETIKMLQTKLWLSPNDNNAIIFSWVLSRQKEKEAQNETVFSQYYCFKSRHSVGYRNARPLTEGYNN